MNKYFILISCCFFLTMYYSSTSSSVGINAQKPFVATPENTVFAFDLHGVVFKKDFYGMIRTILKAPFSMQLMLTLANPIAWYDFFSLFIKRDSAEEIIRTLAGKYPSLEPYVKVCIDVANEQLPIQETVDIIKELKEQGYRLLVLSNIGISTFKNLRKKYPEIFAYFDGFQVVVPDDDWLQKPNIKAYEKFINTFDLYDKNIIFIDDKIQNINGAESVGIYGVHFNSKQDLYKHLNFLNILPF